MTRARRVIAGPLGAVALIVVLMSLAMIAAGTSPIDGFTALIVGALGGRNQIGETLVATTALLFPALGICLAFRAGLFNIGAEGQLLIGALCAGALGAVLCGARADRHHANAHRRCDRRRRMGRHRRLDESAFRRERNHRDADAQLRRRLSRARTRQRSAAAVRSPPEPRRRGSIRKYWLPTMLPDTRLSIALLARARARARACSGSSRERFSATICAPAVKRPKRRDAAASTSRG